jgi:hypothetical protein
MDQRNAKEGYKAGKGKEGTLRLKSQKASCSWLNCLMQG